MSLYNVRGRNKMSFLVELISEGVHDAWWDEKKRQGFHSPNECKSENHKSFMRADWKEQERLENNHKRKFFEWCKKCHTDMYPYEELPEHIKEYDRVTVRTVLVMLDKNDYSVIKDVDVNYNIERNKQLEVWLNEIRIQIQSDKNEILAGVDNINEIVKYDLEDNYSCLKDECEHLLEGIVRIKGIEKIKNKIVKEE